MTDPVSSDDSKTGDSASSDSASSDSASSDGLPPVEETLDRMQRTLRRINIGAPPDLDGSTFDKTTLDENIEAAGEGDVSAETGLQHASSDRGGDGLARLLLTLVQLLHDVLERQAIRRMEADSLTPEEVERIGQALMKQTQEIERICEAFGIDPEDLDIDLGTVHVDNAS